MSNVTLEVSSQVARTLLGDCMPWLRSITGSKRRSLLDMLCGRRLNSLASDKGDASDLAKQLAAQKVMLSLRLRMIGKHLHTLMCSECRTNCQFSTDSKQGRENTEEILNQLNRRFAEIKAIA